MFSKTLPFSIILSMKMRPFRAGGGSRGRSTRRYFSEIRKMRLYSNELLNSREPLTQDEAYELLDILTEDINSGTFEIIKSLKWEEVVPQRFDSFYKGMGVEYLTTRLTGLDFESSVISKKGIVKTKRGYSTLLAVMGNGKTASKTIDLNGKKYRITMTKYYSIYKYKNIIKLLIESRRGPWVLIDDVIDTRTQKTAVEQLISDLEHYLPLGLVYILSAPNKYLIAVEADLMEDLIASFRYKDEIYEDDYEYEYEYDYEDFLDDWSY